MKRKGFKSFVLKLCETKGFADAFLRKCINPRALLGSEGSFSSRCSLRTTIPGRMVVFVTVDVGGVRSKQRSLGSLRSLGTTIPGRMVVLKVCETKGFADAFLVKCINLKELTEKS